MDLSISADSIDPTRVNNFELWTSHDALKRFRARADPPETGIEIRDAVMKEYAISRAREPFSED